MKNGQWLDELKNNLINIYFLFFILPLGFNFLKFIRKWHVYFSVWKHKRGHILYIVCDMGFKDKAYSLNLLVIF